ncbi:hypothetical protein RJT34_24822 [Clitoria ternatea]|uniref:Uncharacterized protein n=1 Tax=Clitoria ternatea TaxID=43366 RepID=A0AAN9FUV8_CLITE
MIHDQNNRVKTLVLPKQQQQRKGKVEKCTFSSTVVRLRARRWGCACSLVRRSKVRRCDGVKLRRQRSGKWKQRARRALRRWPDRLRRRDDEVREEWTLRRKRRTINDDFRFQI